MAVTNTDDTPSAYGGSAYMAAYGLETDRTSANAAAAQQQATDSRIAAQNKLYAVLGISGQGGGLLSEIDTQDPGVQWVQNEHMANREIERGLVGSMGQAQMNQINRDYSSAQRTALTQAAVEAEMIQPPNLNELYRDRFRVVNEQSLIAERGENARSTDPWLMVIPCTNGHIYPHAGDMLGASTNRRGPISKALAMLPCVQVVQDGDDGLNAIFPVEDFDTVAAVMKPRRRRRLSPEHRAKLIVAGAQNRFVGQHGSGAPENGQICDPTVQPASRAA